jgi:CubicO group peptidase (beta-lactamase class C family)
MLISRRAFTGGALSMALGSQLAAPAWAQGKPALATALAAIRAYGEAELAFYGLPGMTLGLTTPDGFGTVLNFGYANADSRAPIGPGTLFQVGSISKCMTAALLHQFVAEGRLGLSDPIGSLMPAIPLPRGNAITVQHLLDHVAGLPADAPLFPKGGLWTAYAPGEHWHYSNTGYEILGKLAEQVGGKPLGQLLEERLFAPLGMKRTRGAIVADDRALYAQGYEAADQLPFARGVPLAPAAWVDVTFGAGCVASTADDMIIFMRALANAAQGRGGLGLSAALGRGFTSHAVPSDTRGMSYGNGLMHVGSSGRSYLHHTGGMVSFSSSFHLDLASGVGAFASSNIGAFAEYRPRILTRVAVEALTNGLAGKPLPSPPTLTMPLSGPAAYVGRYSSPAGRFEIKRAAVGAASPLTIVANGQEAALQVWGGEIFRTTHPAFRRFSLMFQRQGDTVAAMHWGPTTYVRDGTNVRPPASDPQLAKLAGRYVSDSPWLGLAEVVERGGELWIGTEVPLQRSGRDLWRVGLESWSPERASFEDVVDGRPQTFIYSGQLFARHDV